MTAAKYSADGHRAIIKSLKDGATREEAAGAARIDERTLRKWLERGEREGRGKYWQLRVDILEVESKEQNENARRVRAAGAHDWRAAAWMLERKNPRRWGLRVKMEVAEELRTFLNRLEQRLDPSTFKRVLHAATGDLGQGEAGDLSDGTSEEDW
jgi:hypothetical protein